MGNEIPASKRLMVQARSGGQCERCGGRAAEIHHRQRRREGGHGIENLVHLCPGCHRWAHANPNEARREGYIVGAHVPRVRIHTLPMLRHGRQIYFTTTGGVSSPLRKEQG